MENHYLDKLESSLGILIEKLPEIGGLQESARYMLLNQGKRLRPSLAIAILDDLGLLSDEHYAVALSIEILHTASLIHDDLPALDNDDYRRGKLSCHKKYSESLAILLGDYLQTWSLQVLNENAGREHLQALNLVLTEAYQNVCLGQILDMEDLSERDFAIINKLKTASLFAVSFQIAAIQANWSSEQSEKLRSLGEGFGLIFQLINDYKDCFLSPEATGRRDSSDSKNNKQTLINQFETTDEAKKYLEDQIVIWNKDFDSLKLEVNLPFLNLTKIVNCVFREQTCK